VRGFGYVLLGLIVYGSLYPFNWGHGAVVRLPQLVDFRHLILSDVIENIVAFIPIGVALALTADRRARRRDYLIAIVVAVLLQVAQLWLPRQPALSDAMANSLGLGLGVWAAGLVRWLGTRSTTASPVGLALVGLFGLHVALGVVVWLGLGGSFDRFRLLDEWRLSLHVQPFLPWLAGLVAILPLLHPRRRQWARGAAILLVAALVWDGVTPITFQQLPFVWIPFKSLITGFSWGLAISLTWKLFAYGALTRLLMLSRIRAQLAVPLVVVLVFALEIAQTRLGSGSPDITEPLLALLCAWGITQEARVHALRVDGGRRTGLRYFR
jgi:VanZ family protein